MGAEDNGINEQQPQFRAKMTIVWNIDGTVMTDHPVDPMICDFLISSARRATDRFFNERDAPRIAQPGQAPPQQGLSGLARKAFGPFGKPNHG